MSDNPIQYDSDEIVISTEFSSRLSQTIGRITHAVNNSLSTGDIAELKRLNPEDPSAPAFWKLMVNCVGKDGVHLAGGNNQDEAEQRWAVVLSAMAYMQDQHSHGRKLGDALAVAGYSELRLTRLLRATGETLRNLTRGMTLFLVAKGEPFDLLDLARLIFSDDKSWSESFRRQIARSYYAIIMRKEKTS